MSERLQPAENPIVGIICCRVAREYDHTHSVVEKYVDAVADAVGAIPILVPAIGDRIETSRLLDLLDGLLLTGSPSNIDPVYYGGEPSRPGNLADPDRDATILPLIRAAVSRKLPVLGLCRGIQELNVACGGTLHQHVQELPEHLDHRSDKSRGYLGRYDPAHWIDLTPGGQLQKLYDGRERIEINSLHGQAIDRLADGFTIEARAVDGTIEAIRLGSGVSFALGVQWHPEWRATEISDHRIIFEAFRDACLDYSNSRATSTQPKAVA